MAAKAAGTAAATAADPSDQPEEADDLDEDAPVTVALPAPAEDDEQVSPLLAQGWCATQAAPEQQQPPASVAPPAPSNTVDDAAAPAVAAAAAPAATRETEPRPVAAATGWADGRRAVTAVGGEAVAATAAPVPSMPATAEASGLSSPASADDPVSDAPFTSTDASPTPWATIAVPAARAYLRAARALEAGAWAQEADPAGNLPRASEVRAAQPTPAGVAGENRPRDVAPALSAHAAAVLRSLGLTSAITPEEGESTVTPAASSIGDVMGGVAVELAAVDLGSARRESDTHSHSGTTATPNIRATDASDMLSSSSVFSLGAQAPPGTGDPTVVPSQPLAGAPAPEAPLTGQMVKAITLAWRDGVGEAKIRLTPEHLGEVQVSMKVERGQVVAQVVAETAIARAWIDTHQQDLREALAQQGLQLDKLVVTADGQRQQQPQGDGSERQRRPPTRSRSGEPAPRFELSA